MVCGSLNEGVDTMCNCCGCFGTMCCAAGKERCCDPCNHCCCFGPSCCECCPCGAGGCIGYPNHLCGCCGNCNLMWYSGCCTCCFVADLFIATKTDGDKAAEWSNIVCNLVLINVIIVIVNGIGSASPDLMILRNLANLIEIIEYVYIAVVFGYSATKIARAKGLNYEADQCCTTCYEQGCMKTCGTCCSSFDCCCAYSCCYEAHFVQVARTLENDAAMKSAIMEGRPEQCRCCNCWETAKPLELTTGSTSGTDQV